MTSDPLDPGLREELVTTALQAQLKAIDAKRVQRRALEVAEARAFVIRQAEALVAEWLRTTSDPDPATLTNQLATNLGAELLARYELLAPAELLSGILPVSDGLTIPVLPDRPQVQRMALTYGMACGRSDLRFGRGTAKTSHDNPPLPSATQPSRNEMRPSEPLAHGRAPNVIPRSSSSITLAASVPEVRYG